MPARRHTPASPMGQGFAPEPGLAPGCDRCRIGRYTWVTPGTGLHLRQWVIARRQEPRLPIRQRPLNLKPVGQS